MPKFGKRSKERLKGVDAKLVNVLNEVVKYFDITIIEGLRTQERQDQYPIDWDARDDFHYLGGFVLATAAKMGVKIRWGGDWNASSLFKGQRTTKDNNFDDLVHFELMD